jgi:predicted permease
VVTDLLAITFNVVIPIFVMAGVGLLAHKRCGIDPKAVSPLGIYVLMPALLFTSLSTTKMEGDEVLRIGVFTLSLILALVAVTTIVTRLFNVAREESSALTMVVAFMNSANYGLPVCLFAFGQEGFDRAVVFAAFQSICAFSIGVFVAARGKLNWRQALRPMVKMPVLWAAVTALALRASGFAMPLPIERGITVLAAGAIPVTILLLGMQLADMRFERLQVRSWIAVAGRLGGSPALALLLVAVLHPTELTGKVLVLQAAMPAAVNISLLATQFDARPQLVSSAVLLTTGLSLLTVTAWVAYLRGGI